MSVDTPELPRSVVKDSWLTDPRIRGVIVQVALIVGLFAFGWWIVGNTARNLAASNIASGFGFLQARAGFDIAQVPIAYTNNASYGRAIMVGIANTLIVAGTGIVFATILGFLVGIARLSHNFIVRGVATIYVETFRNLPPLLVILFWYFGVMAVLPLPRDAIELPFGAYISNRGLQTPLPIFGEGGWLIAIAFLVGIVATYILSRANKRRQIRTGERRSLLGPAVLLIVGLPLVTFFALGSPLSFEYPVLGTFNLNGGFQMLPPFVAIFLALSVYTASFIAEIVRAGILSVSKGQNEAAAALGLRRNHALRLVIVPQAFRVIIPPLTSQYLNLTKNSSLGLAVGYPELVAVGNTVLNQSGQSIEVVVIWMTVYLSISVAVSLLMNLFNRKMALVER